LLYDIKIYETLGFQSKSRNLGRIKPAKKSNGFALEMSFVFILSQFPSTLDTVNNNTGNLPPNLYIRFRFEISEKELSFEIAVGEHKPNTPHIRNLKKA